MKAKDIIEILEEDGLRKLAIKQTDWIEARDSQVKDLETDRDYWIDKYKKTNEAFGKECEKVSNACADYKRSQDRVAQLFGKFERMARILNQTDDRDDVTDVQIIEQIVDVIAEEINHENGVFTNHKGEEL